MRTDNSSQRSSPAAAAGGSPAAAVRDLLFDRDGTLIEDKGYLSDPAQVTLLPGVAPALRRLALSGRRLFMVSNQSGVGRGRFGTESVVACNAQLARLLAAHEVFFTDMLFCPHSPEENCACRKPRTGMWDELRGRYGLHAAHTAMIGDKSDDVRFGRNAGLYAVLVLTGEGRGHAAGLGLPLPDSGCLPQDPDSALPHLVAADLAAVADFFLSLQDFP